MFNFGFGEIALLLFFALLFIGPKKLPGLAKGLGKGIKEFNDAIRGITNTDSEADVEKSKSPSDKLAEDTFAKPGPVKTEDEQPLTPPKDPDSKS